VPFQKDCVFTSTYPSFDPTQKKPGRTRTVDIDFRQFHHASSQFEDRSRRSKWCPQTCGQAPTRSDPESSPVRTVYGTQPCSPRPRTLCPSHPTPRRERRRRRLCAPNERGWRRRATFSAHPERNQESRALPSTLLVRDAVGHAFLSYISLPHISPVIVRILHRATNQSMHTTSLKLPRFRLLVSFLLQPLAHISGMCVLVFPAPAILRETSRETSY
jgi:hypothetical protein